jgi:hypothetical protein
MSTPDFAARGHRTIYEDDPDVPAACTPIAGKAGTLTLWHGWMIHEVQK